MNSLRIKAPIFIVALFFIITTLAPAYGWHDETHLAIAKAAGYSKWYNAVGAQPLHHVPRDDFNKTHHMSNDGIVEDEVLKNSDRIVKNMYPVHLRPDFFEEDLSKEIACIANRSTELAHKLRTENRDMTEDEAYMQLGHSASLFKAILKYFERPN